MICAISSARKSTRFATLPPGVTLTGTTPELGSIKFQIPYKDGVYNISSSAELTSADSTEDLSATYSAGSATGADAGPY